MARKRSRRRGSAFAQATSVCKKRGKTGFKRGQAGQRCRSKLAEKIKRRK